MSRRMLLFVLLPAAAYWLLDSLLLAAGGATALPAALLVDGSGAAPIHRMLGAALFALFGAGGLRLLAGGGAPASQRSRTNEYCSRGQSLEQALRQRNEELEAIFSNLAVLIAVMDREFNFVRVNSAYASVAGFSPEELVGRNHFELYPHQQNERIFREAVASGVPCHATARPFTHPELPERTTYWDWTLAPLKDDEGRVYGVLLTLVDVTRRVNDQAQITKLSRLYKVLSESNKAIARIKERDRLLEAICRVMVDKGGFRLAWIGVADEGKQELTPIVSAGDDNGYLRSVRVSLTDPAHAGSPARISLESGEPVTIGDIARDERFAPWAKQALTRGYRSGTTFPIHQGDEVVAVLAALSGEADFFTGERVALMADLSEDISFALDALEEEERRVAAEEALHRAHDELELRVARRTTELEQMNRQLESFSYSVSHDLRGPLRAINGFSGMLMEEYEDRLDDDGRDALQRIAAASNRMDGLIEGLLTLSRIARTAIRPAELDLVPIADQAIAELKEADPSRQVEFLRPDRLPVIADRDLVQVALTNLIGNAWKFTGQEPNPRIELGMRQEQAGPVFFLRDNGAGFSMAHSAHLFRAFERLHEPGEFPGTGIGLATVARIIEAHGGRIRGEGREGEGAVFYFSFGGAGSDAARPVDEPGSSAQAS